MNKTILEANVERSRTGCWIWKGAVTTHGYARRGSHRVHRAAYELYIGLIPEGMFVLHKCDTKLCVNPDHLYTGTRIDNAIDAINRKQYFNSAKTHCNKGHLLSGDNLRITPAGRRVCKTCDRVNTRKKMARYRERKHNA